MYRFLLHPLSISFKDEEQRQKLNRITHPEIYREMCWEVREYFRKKYRPGIFFIRFPVIWRDLVSGENEGRSQL